jgi:hypothetical protein
VELLSLRSAESTEVPINVDVALVGPQGTRERWHRGVAGEQIDPDASVFVHLPPQGCIRNGPILAAGILNAEFVDSPLEWFEQD